MSENTGPIRSKTTFVPVSEAEFTSVSDLIRGRVKLQEVNSVSYIHPLSCQRILKIIHILGNNAVVTPTYKLIQVYETIFEQFKKRQGYAVPQ